MATGRGLGYEIDPVWPKLDALERLRSICTESFRVPSFVVFGAAEWAEDPHRVLEAVDLARLGPVVIVRSCAADEDVAPCEPPGFFESVLDVNVFDREALHDAIGRVCASYHRRPGGACLPHKVVVQTQLLNAKISGVCRVGDSDLDYLDVNYDDSLLRTDAVTAGLTAKRLYLSSSVANLPSPWHALRTAVEVVRAHFDPPFFIEFAIDSSGVPTLFQVRSDRRPHAREPTGRPPTSAELREAEALLTQCGPLSVMADWNPAEMLGRNPKPLDVSLYDELLLSGAWASGRASLGWRSPQDPRLMVQLGWQPFIKLRVSLQTLLPKSLPLELANKLVEDRVLLVSEDRQLHDKVEFRVMWSAFAFNEDATRENLIARGFTSGEVARLFTALKVVTRETIAKAPAALKADLAGMAALAEERDRLTQIKEATRPTAVSRALRSALQICRKHGTIPFARQARIAFSFRYIINHLVETGAVSASFVQAWESGLNTVARRLSQDLARLSAGTLERAVFDRRYGHLRPQTYSLTSLRYDERPAFAAPAIAQRMRRHRRPAETPRLGEILACVGADPSQSRFWQSAAGAFRAREDLKFGFTALLSDVLLVLARVAAWCGEERRTLRELPIGELLDLMASSKDWCALGRRVAAVVASRPPPVLWQLPDVIFTPSDLHVVQEVEVRPTFIGSWAAHGPPRLITGDFPIEEPLAGSVVTIEAADPGFDWIFAQPIAALVTAYGGEFSHMGLRCAEFGIPAALGCGPKLFDAVASAARVVVDPTTSEVWGDKRRLYPT